MVLYLIRHGKTDYNEKGLLQGKSNIPLNATGIKESEKLHNYFLDKDVNICFSSPLVRALDTAKIIFPDIDIITSDMVIERTLGKFEGKSHEEYHFYDFWNYKINSNEGGVEPVQDLLKRSDLFLKLLKEKYVDKNIAVVSHGAFLKALHFSIIGYNEDTSFKEFSLKNCEVKKYDV